MVLVGPRLTISKAFPKIKNLFCIRVARCTRAENLLFHKPQNWLPVRNGLSLPARLNLVHHFLTRIVDVSN